MLDLKCHHIDLTAMVDTSYSLFTYSAFTCVKFLLPRAAAQRTRIGTWRGCLLAARVDDCVTTISMGKLWTFLCCCFGLSDVWNDIKWHLLRIYSQLWNHKQMVSSFCVRFNLNNYIILLFPLKSASKWINPGKQLQKLYKFSSTIYTLYFLIKDLIKEIIFFLTCLWQKKPSVLAEVGGETQNNSWQWTLSCE